MSLTGLEAFDSTIQETNLWLKEIMDELGTTDKHKAYLVLRAVLQTLRDRLTVEEAADLGAQLPVLIKGVYYEGWKPGNKPTKIKHKEEFFERVRSYFRTEPDIDPQSLTQAIFRVLDKRITRGEIKDIKGILPEELRTLWPQPVSA
jgi:uncharacterized protein (DUF2267 family)